MGEDRRGRPVAGGADRWRRNYANDEVLTLPPRLSELIKREVELDGQLYTVIIGPEGVHIAPKGKRKGHELSWSSLASGEAELNRDLVRSLTKQAKTEPK
jgi:hypothetical protein